MLDYYIIVYFVYMCIFYIGFRLKLLKKKCLDCEVLFDKKIC